MNNMNEAIVKINEEIEIIKRLNNINFKIVSNSKSIY